ncbi:TPA: hypothetical protein JG855_002039 [Vibrio parahaemolyticus]|uniref:hypothetical protein n=1 Tax=Vibrio TaxID=662 RepID=UPI001EEC41FA|nr:MULTISPECIES: hypothetical protein [Vibrio]HAV1497949.1 hypothetical protein [Vibrio parahaemolyticus]MCG6354808.1 hypothetical protein [Vibrio alginolyticus]MCK8112520.1 hypothetical protein [Vibrio sp. 2CM40D]HAV1503118.1 hypothetical protein [Vibrio parahaemolyticus]HBL4682787.1 hypothetical protein [Vibrio parahaemolyticus]
MTKKQIERLEIVACFRLGMPIEEIMFRYMLKSEKQIFKYHNNMSTDAVTLTMMHSIEQSIVEKGWV